MTPSPLTEAEIAARLRASGCVFAEDEARLLIEAAGDDAALARMVGDRCRGVPLPHVIGWAELCGERVLVSPGVFAPRARTELLTELAVTRARPGSVVVDLCCGTGAVATVVARRVRGSQVHACDIDADAVVCARRNLEGLGEVHQGDLFEALPADLQGRVDIVVASPPYVPTGDLALLPRDVREHEPAHALDGGRDGLALHRRIAAEASAWLSSDGAVLVETSRRQAPAAQAIFEDGGYQVRVHRWEDPDATAVVAS